VIDLSIRDTFLGAPFETPAGMIQQTHLAIGLAIRACQAGHRVLFATAAVGRPSRRGVQRRTAANRTHPAGPLPAAGHSTKSATFLSKPKPPTCSSSSSPPARRELSST